MTEERQDGGVSGATDESLNRGEFLKRGGVALGGVVIGSGMLAEKSWARPIQHLGRDAAVGTINIGYVSPLTGADAGFGQPDPFILGLIRHKVAKGVKIGGRTYRVNIIEKDAQSTPSVSAKVAQELINTEKVDILLATSTPEVVVPVSSAAEAAGVPAISTVVPWQSWWLGLGNSLTQPKPYKWIYHFSFGAGDFFESFTSLWPQVKTNKVVGVLYPNDADGNAVRGGLAPALQKAGYTVVDAGPYEDGTTDFSSQIATFKQHDCQIFNTFPIPSDFTTFWRQAAQQGYTDQIKIAQISKTCLFVSQVEAVGLKLGNKLATGFYWGPNWPGGSGFTGVSNKELGSQYEAHAKQYWNQQLGPSLALFDIAFAAMEKAGNPKNKAAVAKALSHLKVKTPLGELEWGSKNKLKAPLPNVVATPILSGQWLRTKKGSKYPLEFLVEEHKEYPAVPLQGKLQPYT